MNISPDWIKYWEFGPFTLNATIVFTWIVMGLLILISWLARRGLSSGPKLSWWRNMLEATLSLVENQIRDVIKDDPAPYLPFLGTLFLFIVLSNLLQAVPGFQAPTGSLSTTTALALLTAAAVPFWGIRKTGLWAYLKNYAKPTVVMLPFNIVGEFSRTLALAVRLFGNIMSGTMIGGVLLIIAPILFPVLMQLLGLLTGLIQAYIFFILAAVYIAAGMETHEKETKTK